MAGKRNGRLSMILKENAQELALIVKETGADQGLSL
jgi:hypothetical protein